MITHVRRQGIPRPAATYRGARRNGARARGRVVRRRPGTHPWWRGIEARYVPYQAGEPRGRDFNVGGALLNFFFPGPKQGKRP